MGQWIIFAIVFGIVALCVLDMGRNEGRRK